MKLSYAIILRLSFCLMIVLGAWAAFFYYAMMEELNDETDDMLENYSELLIRRSLAGEELPSNNLGTNNSYFIRQITPEAAQMTPVVSYSDDMIFIESRNETEPARILRHIFRNKQEQYFELTVATPTIDKDDLREAIMNWIIILYVSLLLMIMFINIWVLYRSLRPLHQLLKWLDQTNLNTKIEPIQIKTQVKEFNKLNTAVENFALRANAAFEQQKQFIGNASHEIQTPIAICQNRLELLCDSNLSENQLTEISKTLDTLQYISRLNKSLLLLSKIDNGEFDRSLVNINQLVRKYVSDYQEIYAHRQIEVEIRKEELCIIEMNDSLAIILITNLLRNAFVHTYPQGTIIIDLTNQVFRISNSSQGRSLDAHHIFERFHQGDKKEGSTGLGLAIVDAICHLYDFKITYHYNQGLHIFEINFK